MAVKMEKASDLRVIAALRRRARWYRAQSPDAADHLVEMTLEAAIEEIDYRPTDISLQEWLDSSMRRYLN